MRIGLRACIESSVGLFDGEVYLIKGGCSGLFMELLIWQKVGSVFGPIRHQAKLFLSQKR